MHKREISQDLLLKQRLLPLYYHDDLEVSTKILQSLYNAGIRMVEYTARGKYALENFRGLKKLVAHSFTGMQLGIGTIKDEVQAKNFIEAGADFIVSPIIHLKTGNLVHESGLLWIPGCMTPTEVAAAEQAGAIIIKIFPGSLLGPSYISAIRELFPGLKFIPTGGVETNEANLREWFQSGVVAVGMGSKLISKELLETKNYGEIGVRTTNLIEIIQKIAGEK